MHGIKQSFCPQCRSTDVVQVITDGPVYYQCKACGYHNISFPEMQDTDG